MQIDAAGLRASLLEGAGAPRETDEVSPQVQPRAGVDTSTSRAFATPVEIAPAPAAPLAEWMDPVLGGLSALGPAEHYLPLLQSMHDELSQRQDPVARLGALAIMEELRNHAVLTAHINSLIA